MAITDKKIKTPQGGIQQKKSVGQDLNTGFIKQLIKKYAPKQSGDGILSVDVTLTPAQVLALGTTPIEIVPAPGPGKVIQPVTSIVEYEQVAGGTTDYSQINGQPIIFYEYDFGYNPNLANSYLGKGLTSNLTISTGQWLFVSPASNVFNGMGISYIFNPVNKAVNLWYVIDIGNPFTLPSVGDRTITFRFNYRILDLNFSPNITPQPQPFTLKTSCNGGAFTPFDGTETNWAITTLYTAASSDVLPNFVLNPVYEGAGVWNLGDGIVNYPTNNLNGQGGFACYISCVKGGQTIHYETRRTFGSIAGTVFSINATYIL